MVTAQEVFGQLYEASPPVQKSMQTVPPIAAKGAMMLPVAVAGAAGFLLTPSRRLAVNTVGGAVAASVGNIGRKRLADERQKAAVPAVAAALSEGLTKVDSEALAAIASEYDVPKKQFESQLAELYVTFLNACLTSPTVDTVELSDLLRLQKLLKLSAAQTGNQIYTAARQLYSRHRAYLEDTEDNDSKKLLQKFVFLAERVLAGDDSPEGYRYESLRLQKLFSLTTPEWRGMAEAAAVPWYEKALDSAVLQSKPVTSQQLASVRDSLGLTDSAAEGMHATVFAQCADAMVTPQGAFAPADKERLAAVQTLLNMDDATKTRTLQPLTAPLYSTSFEAIVQEVAGMGADADAATCASLGAKLSARQAELLIEPTDAFTLEAATLKSVAQTRLSAAVKFMRAQDVPSGLAEVQQLVAFCDRLAAFMVGTEHAAGPADAALPSLFGGLTSGTKQSEVLALYRVLLLHYLEKLKVEESEAETLSRLRVVLELSEEQATSVYQAAAGPLFRKAVTAAVGASEMGSSQKEELQASIANLALPADVTKAISIEVYSAKLTEFAGTGTILDEEQAATLTTLRDFLSLGMDDVSAAHEKACGPAYRNSVREVMGGTGVIPDEYWEGLAMLRERLCISEEAAQALFAVEVTARMKQFGTKCVEAMEEKAQRQQSGEEDAKGDMNVDASSLATEVLNLVDFAVASKALATKEAAGKEFEVCGANLREEFELTTLKQVYKQYLIEAFSGGNAVMNQRLFDNLERASLVFGLEKNEVSIIHNEIGSYIYRNYISKALKKGPLGQEETNFLGSIKDALGMEEEKCQELVREQQQARVSILIEQMFEKSQVIAEDVRAMRDEADLYDVDLAVDLQLSSLKLERMFLCELEDLVDSGELQADDMGSLIELCEPLHIAEETAQRFLEETVQKRASGGVLQAAAAMRQQERDSAYAELERMLKFAALLPETTAETKAVSSGERNELFMLFQAGQLTKGGATAESAAALELLKGVLGLGAA